MKIVAHGIDLVELGRIAEVLERHGERFLDRVFTQREQADAAGVKRRVEKLAGRFAAKEAVLKLIGTGWRGKIAWTDIEVVNGEMGEPVVNVSGEVKRIADEMGVEQMTLSITHTAELAMASVVALRGVE
ncbi:Holo-[acyl-carrier-protein] synthase [Anaerohalosphaera lusitana]|uniref:Holo-[acyl-carrier-protein] synthase n=1 Tax=Anaerohalosphaera lusitana TaxID=1936003 RepID=A0A1U9NK90_9BACT|nr:holo-ACP synthase [Anaerohalosphaera lusitana]AQT68154.1 Holo-[acyl-carrier-protein] synthase [Anaerohalosphaera lusitana]